MYLNIFRLIGIFCAGGLVTANLSSLIGTSPDYVAEWWKVAMFLLVALFLSYMLLREEK